MSLHAFLVFIESDAVTPPAVKDMLESFTAFEDCVYVADAGLAMQVHIYTSLDDPNAFTGPRDAWHQWQETIVASGADENEVDNAFINWSQP